MRIVAALMLFTLAGIISTSAFAQSDSSEDYSRNELFSIIRNAQPGVDVFALPSKFKFPNNARDNSTFGVDFSHHQEEACNCELDWTAIAKEKVKYVYLKATQGIRYTDPTMSTNLHRIQSTDLDVGLYHFFTANDYANDQARHFIEVVNKLPRASQLPPSLDLEWDPGPMRNDCPADAIVRIRMSSGEALQRCDKWAFVSADDIIARANTWLDSVKDSIKRDAVLYTSGTWWRSRIGTRNRIQDLHTGVIWVADYSKGGLATEKPRIPPGASWTLWQFTDAAALTTAGQVVYIDASIYEGGMADFEKLFGSR